jgi:hypothetical protein
LMLSWCTDNKYVADGRMAKARSLRCLTKSA